MRFFLPVWRRNLKAILNAAFSPMLSPEPTVQAAALILLWDLVVRKGAFAPLVTPST